MCLKGCNEEQGPENGLACSERSGELVWAPMTTCFAFSRFGGTCNGEDADCSVINDAPFDGICRNLVCTYSCLNGDTGDDAWCPVGAVCGEGFEYCEPEE